MRPLSQVLARGLAATGLGLCAWEGAIGLFGIPTYIVPHVWSVGESLYKHWTYLSRHCLVTLGESTCGAAIGIMGGILVGASLANSRIARWLAEPYLVAFQSFPREALAPLLVVWFGFGVIPKIVMASLICFFPMALAALSAFLKTPRELCDLLWAQGATPWQLFIFVRVPNAVPSLVGGAKVALPLAVIGAVIGEFIGGSQGLGYIVATSAGQSDTPLLFSALVLLGVIGLSTLALIRTLEHLVRRRFFGHLQDFN